MKRKLGVLTLIGAVMLSAAPVWAQGDFYVVGGGGVGTRITSLPKTITDSGYYYLGGNLTCALGTAITVNATNVTIDLMGFTITGNTNSGSYGIYSNYRNLEIRNCTIHGCYAGIYGNGGNSRVISVKASYNAALAIQLTGSGNLIQNCNAFNTGPATFYQSCIFATSGTITGCSSIDNTIGGIGMYGPGLVTNNNANSNGTTGFTLGTYIYVNGNCAMNNTGSNYNAPSTTLVWGMNAGGPLT